MKEFYTHGTEAYEPIPIEVPSHLPEEPKKEQPLIEARERGISPLTVLSAGVVLLLLFGLLFSMMRLFEVRSEQAELNRQLRQLRTRQEHLIAEFESNVDMDAVAQRAEELGMHIPYADQVQYVHIELPEPVQAVKEEVEMGLLDAIAAMVRDMEAYFS